MFTNLTQDHLDYHGTMEKYAAAKARLFQGVGAGAPRVAVIDADDAYGAMMKDAARNVAQVWTYGHHEAPDFLARNVVLSARGATFELVTPEEVPDPQDLNLWLEVDGHLYQRGSTRTMVFGVAHLISYLSRFMSLHPGDVLSTGTPPGVGLGQKPPRYLAPGNLIRLGIDGLGTQTQRVVAETL